MNEFLSVLKVCLMERMPQKEVDEQMTLYENYFKEELAAGKSMDEILTTLGAPEDVADLLVERAEREREEENQYQQEVLRAYQKQMSAQELNDQITNPEHGFKATYVEDKGWDVRLGKLALNTWYGRLLILGIVCVLFIVFSMFAK